mmetsp:Transcript_8519/g.25028  ORF Transcript_8519/g.25028 Transcript_8519/m.25028 type:complete len:722 (-) Transcript_8519:68-2233(-)
MLLHLPLTPGHALEPRLSCQHVLHGKQLSSSFPPGKPHTAEGALPQDCSLGHDGDPATELVVGRRLPANGLLVLGAEGLQVPRGHLHRLLRRLRAGRSGAPAGLGRIAAQAGPVELQHRGARRPPADSQHVGTEARRAAAAAVEADAQGPPGPGRDRVPGRAHVHGRKLQRRLERFLRREVRRPPALAVRDLLPVGPPAREAPRGLCAAVLHGHVQRRVAGQVQEGVRRGLRRRLLILPWRGHHLQQLVEHLRRAPLGRVVHRRPALLLAPHEQPPEPVALARGLPVHSRSMLNENLADLGATLVVRPTVLDGAHERRLALGVVAVDVHAQPRRPSEPLHAPCVQPDTCLKDVLLLGEELQHAAVAHQQHEEQGESRCGHGEAHRVLVPQVDHGPLKVSSPGNHRLLQAPAAIARVRQRGLTYDEQDGQGHVYQLDQVPDEECAREPAGPAPEVDRIDETEDVKERAEAAADVPHSTVDLIAPKHVHEHHRDAVANHQRQELHHGRVLRGQEHKVDVQLHPGDELAGAEEPVPEDPEEGRRVGPDVNLELLAQVVVELEDAATTSEEAHETHGLQQRAHFKWSQARVSEAGNRVGVTLGKVDAEVGKKQDARADDALKEAGHRRGREGDPGFLPLRHAEHSGHHRSLKAAAGDRQGQAAKDARAQGHLLDGQHPRAAGLPAHELPDRVRDEGPREEQRGQHREKEDRVARPPEDGHGQELR